MKKVLVIFGERCDLIECPDRIATEFRHLMEDIFDWINNDANAVEYRLYDELGELGFWINTETVLKYINTKCLEKGEPKAILCESNVDRSLVQADKYYEFFV